MGKDKRYHNSDIVLCSRNSNIFRLTIAAVFLVLASSVFIVSTVYDSDGSYADTNGGCGNGLTWSCVNGTLNISKSSEGTGAMNDYTDASRAPWSTSAFTSVVIGDGVTSIGNYAFNGCTSMTSVTIPNSVTSIGNYAFNGCTGLTLAAIGAGATSLGTHVFAFCTSLTSAIIPDNVTSIGDSTFNGCTKLASVVLGDGLIFIGNYTFYNCISLTSVTIGNSLTSINGNTFMGCTGLTSADIPDNVTSIGDSAFSLCTGLISVNIPSSVTYIGEQAFRGCSSLTSVNIPSSVTTIIKSAFYGCSELTSIVIPSSVTSLSDKMFYECSRLTSVSIPNSVVSIGQATFYGCSELTSIVIPSSVTSMDTYAFYGCTKLASADIQGGVIIPQGTFFNCGSLSYLSVPSSVTSIGNYAFFNCNKLVDIALTGTESSFNMAMSNGVLSGNKLTTASCNLAKIIIDGYVDLKGLSSNTSPSFKLIFAEGVTKDQVIDSSGSAATSDICSDGDLSGSVYRYNGSKWVKDSATRTVEFEANGGSCNFSKRVTMANSKITLPTPVKTGYNFEGWHLSANLDDAAVSTEYTVTGDVVLYAKYTERSYTITYNSNGGSGSIDAGTPTYSELHTGYNLKPCTFTPPAGMAFLGWAIGFSSLYNENATISDDVISGNVVVRAIWSPNVNVTFDAYGGSMNQTEKIVVLGGKYGDLPTPIKDGHTFNGWDFAGTKITASSTVYTSANHTLTALWLSSTVGHSIKVSFDSNGGSHVGDISVEYGSTYGPLPTVTRAGYTFGGWFTSSTGGTLVSSTTNVTAAVDHTLFAHWSHSTNASAVDPNAGNHGFSVGDYIYPIIAAIASLSMLFFIFVLLKRRKEKE